MPRRNLPKGPLALRLLVIDDEPEVGASLGQLLQALGHAVVLATSGPAGLAALAAAPFDAVLVDLSMPGMSGAEVARAVKAGAPALPVVLLTAWGAEADAVSGGRLVDHMLRKPLRVGELQAVLRALAEGGRRTTTTTRAAV